MALPIETQIKVLENISWKADDNFKNSKCFYEHGLCELITNSLDDLGILHGNRLSSYIPLLTRENAIKYANARELNWFDYWWPIISNEFSPYHYRKYFINWIIGELKKQLTDK